MVELGAMRNTTFRATRPDGSVAQATLVLDRSSPYRGVVEAWLSKALGAHSTPLGAEALVTPRGSVTDARVGGWVGDTTRLVHAWLAANLADQTESPAALSEDRQLDVFTRFLSGDSAASKQLFCKASKCADPGVAQVAPELLSHLYESRPMLTDAQKKALLLALNKELLTQPKGYRPERYLDALRLLIHLGDRDSLFNLYRSGVVIDKPWDTERKTLLVSALAPHNHDYVGFHLQKLSSWKGTDSEFKTEAEAFVSSLTGPLHRAMPGIYEDLQSLMPELPFASESHRSLLGSIVRQTLDDRVYFSQQIRDLWTSTRVGIGRDVGTADKSDLRLNLKFIREMGDVAHHVARRVRIRPQSSDELLSVFKESMETHIADARWHSVLESQFDKELTAARDDRYFFHKQVELILDTVQDNFAEGQRVVFGTLLDGPLPGLVRRAKRRPQSQPDLFALLAEAERQAQQLTGPRRYNRLNGIREIRQQFSTQLLPPVPK